MKFRKIVRTVACIGALSFSVAALLVHGSRNQWASNPEFVAATTIVNEENFDEVVLTSPKPVVVDFYGDYCVVCRQLEPKLLTLAEEYSDAAVFARVNVQEAPELIRRYGVRQVPTLVVIHQGKPRFQGAGLSAIQPLQVVLEEANRKTGP